MSLSMGSFFAGIGGPGLGARQIGIPTRFVSDIYEPARAVLTRRFPEATLLGDIRDLEPADLPPVDIFTGGFPCQDLSVAGRRAGLAGERSGLFWEVIRLTQAICPTWIILENVAGLLSSNEGRDMGAVLGALADIGYGVCYRVLDAKHFGVAQQRRRVIIVGHSGGQCDLAGAVLLEPNGSGRNPSENSSPEADTASSFAVGAGSRRFAPTLTAERGQRNDPTQAMFLPVPGRGVRRLTPVEWERLQGFPDNWTSVPYRTGRTADSHRYHMIGDAGPVPMFRWVLSRLAVVEATNSQEVAA